MQVKQTILSEKFRFLWLSALIVFLDQLTKIIIKTTLPIYQAIHIWGDKIMLTHVQNPGAAFSLSLGSVNINRPFFIVVTFFAMLFVLYLMYRSETRLQQIALCLVVGGGVGNWIDRIVVGTVTDFVDVDFPNIIMDRFPVFNVADSAITIGMCLLIIDLLFNHQAHQSLKHENNHNSGIES